jgi:hypothetical protein
VRSVFLRAPHPAAERLEARGRNRHAAFDVRKGRTVGVGDRLRPDEGRRRLGAGSPLPGGPERLGKGVPAEVAITAPPFRVSHT